MIKEHSEINIMKQEYWLNVAKRQLEEGEDRERVKRVIEFCSDNNIANQVMNFIEK